MIQAITNYLVEPDKRLMELLKEIKGGGTEDDIDASLQVKKRIDAFLIGEYL